MSARVRVVRDVTIPCVPVLAPIDWDVENQRLMIIGSGVFPAVGSNILLYDHALTLLKRNSLIPIPTKRKSRLKPEQLTATLAAQNKAFAELREKFEAAKRVSSLSSNITAAASAAVALAASTTLHVPAGALSSAMDVDSKTDSKTDAAPTAAASPAPAVVSAPGIAADVQYASEEVRKEQERKDIKHRTFSETQLRDAKSEVEVCVSPRSALACTTMIRFCWLMCFCYCCLHRSF